MQGNYLAAISYCSEAAKILEVKRIEDNQVYSCMGVAASYLAIEVFGNSYSRPRPTVVSPFTVVVYVI